MSNDKPIVKSELRDHDKPNVEILDSIHPEITSISDVLFLTARSRDDGEENCYGFGWDY
jgi:hypothetical protein